MRQQLLIFWYSLLFLLLLQGIGYEVTGYVAEGYRTLVWEKFNKDVHTLHDIDKQLPYATSMNRYARRVGISPQLIASLIKTESSFQPRALSAAGAYGLMQIMPDTWRQVNGVCKACIGRHRGECTSECYYNGDLNIQIGTEYLSQLLKKYQGNMILALAAYNAGPEAVDRYQGIPPYHETQLYTERVINDWYMRENKKMPYPTLLITRRWDKAHQLIGWSFIITLLFSVWTVWHLVKKYSSWCWR